MADPKVDAWMPLWIGAYLADTMTLTTQQHGAYLLLLFAYWRNRGPLADDDQDLASIVKASPDEWLSLRRKLERFFSVEAGVWRHKRADDELKNAQEGRAKASEKASKAATAKWEKARREAEAAASKDAPSIAQAVPEQCPTPSPITSSSPTSKKKPREPALPRPDDVGEQVWSDWLALRKAKKAPVTMTVLDGAKAEALKAGMSLDAFLRIWCTRGTQGLQADWLKPHELNRPHDRKDAGRTPGRRADFASKDYTAGVTADGSLA